MSALRLATERLVTRDTTTAATFSATCCAQQGVLAMADTWLEMPRLVRRRFGMVEGRKYVESAGETLVETTRLKSLLKFSKADFARIRGMNLPSSSSLA